MTRENPCHIWLPYPVLGSIVGFVQGTPGAYNDVTTVSAFRGDSQEALLVPVVWQDFIFNNLNFFSDTAFYIMLEFCHIRAKRTFDSSLKDITLPIPIPQLGCAGG